MQVTKILNNNLIMVEDAQGHEQIVMGRGLRFINQVGEELKEQNIQKVFVLKKEKTREWVQLLENVPASHAEAIQDAIYLISRQMQGKLNDQIFVTLFDHLVFALERYEKQVVLQNRLLWEVRQFYPAEFALGLQLTEYLNQRLGISLPEEEAGNIAFHLVNAQTENPNMEQTMLAIRMLKDIFNIVQFSFTQEIRKDSIHYSRFATHMQFFLQRVLENKMLSDNDASIFYNVVKQYPESYQCACKIQNYVKNSLQVDISKEEMLYLTVHIARIIK